MALSEYRPKQVVQRLLKALPERKRQVLLERFGLEGAGEMKTLDAIGKSLGVTRERVRQIENAALSDIRDSDAYKKESAIFEALHKEILEQGSLVDERSLLEHLSKDVLTQRTFHFLLVLGEDFFDVKEDEFFTRRWYVDRKIANTIEDSLRKLYASLSDEEVLTENELINRFLEGIEDLNDEYRDREIARRWLGIAKQIDSNPIGEWGRSTAPHVRAKSMRDFAYLAIKRNGSPMHFSEVAKAIEQLFKKKAHTATTHNELIKDDRFILVGRGMYALKEWGYSTGIVKDVIANILKTKGPLTREEIVNEVKKERYVKDTTILANLQDKKRFAKQAGGTYALKGA